MSVCLFTHVHKGDTLSEFFEIGSCDRVKALAPDARLWATRVQLAAPIPLSHMPLGTEWQQVGAKWANKNANNLNDDLTIAAYRQFIQRLGLRKVRPAAENLIRRFMLGKSPAVEFSINPLVDAGNTASAQFGIPIAMFDASRLAEPLRLTVSDGGELFQPIGSNQETLPAGAVILRDQERVVSLFSCRDCDHTKVTTDTTNLLILACQVENVDDAAVKFALQRTVQLLGRL